MRGIIGDVNAAVVRRMALDVGDRRIGIAVTDRLGMTAHGRPTRVRTRIEDDVLHIRELVEGEEIAEVVVGHPLHMDGKRSRQTDKTEAFAERLASELAVPVVFWDERLTSFAAEQQLEELGMDWRKRRQRVDEVAATLILEDYLANRP